jgi:cell filamentation protein
MTDDPYVYAGSSVLKNRLGLTDQAALDAAERQLTRTRAVDGVPVGDLDLAHPKAIHRHLFQDVYDWAGEIRTVEISKGGHQFIFRQFIAPGMTDIHRRLVVNGFFGGLSLEDFAAKAGQVLGDVNYVHPFREGNGRTQLHYLKQLCARAGHHLDLRRIDGIMWIEASRRAHHAEYSPMAEAIRAALSDSRDRAATGE